MNDSQAVQGLAGAATAKTPLIFRGVVAQNEADPELEAIRHRMVERLQAEAQQASEASAGPAKPIDVGEDTFDRTTLEHPFVLVDLWAPWCGPCRVVGPILEEVAAERQGGLVVAKVNVDEHPRVAQRFRVQGIPTMLLFKGGRLVDQVSGAMRKEQLDRWLDHHA